MSSSDPTGPTRAGPSGPARRTRAKPEPPRSLSLAALAESMGLMRVAGGQVDLGAVMVTTSEVNRPGLQLTGYLEHFNRDRLQIIGWIETAYLSGLDADTRAQRLDGWFAQGFPALIVARGLHVMPDMVAAADRHGVPVFATEVLTSEFAGSLTWLLIHALAPRTIIQGGLVDVYGEGVLIQGERELGASDTALELIRRGHRLISDETVEILRINADHLRGRGREGQRHTIDIPGVGEVNVEELFGMGAIKPDSRVTLIVTLEARDLDKEYERVGFLDTSKSMFGVELAHVTIPVQPGRNLAVVIEAAALNHRMRGLGYNAAAELLDK